MMGIVPDESNLTMKWMVWQPRFCAALYGMRKEEGGRNPSAFEQFRLKDAGKRPFKAYSRNAPQADHSGAYPLS